MAGRGAKPEGPRCARLKPQDENREVMSEEPSKRLQKYLAHAGVASRRKSEDLIRQGRVSVNGQVVTELGTRVDPAQDDVRVDGRPIRPAGRHVYVMLNKPRDVISSMRDSRGRRALGDLVSLPQRLYPVGRLDLNSEGLILLTDDGELANLLTHPRYEHEKEYRAWVNGEPTEETLQAWQQGVMLEGQATAPAGVEVLARRADATLLRVVMREGRKRQIRRVAELLGHPVRELKRIRLGPLELGPLEVGQWRYLTDREVRSLEALKRQHRGRGPLRRRGQAGARRASGGSRRQT
jgi:23S rRNA pseudouridine2605 synthase